MKEIKIDQATENQRLDKFLNKYFKEAGTSFIYKMLRKKNITLNNKKATGAEKLVAGDCIKVFFSDETFEKIRAVRKLVPEGISLGVRCANDLHMAAACAAAAIRAGADEIKVSSVGRGTASLNDLAVILYARGESLDVKTSVQTMEMNRVINQIREICDTTQTGRTPFEFGVREEEGIFLTAADDIAIVAEAAKQLGYDLSDDDKERVFAAFSRIAEKKEQVGSRELDAIIASAAMQVPAAYKIDSFIINSGNNITASAHMKLNKDGKILESVCLGDGPVDAAFLAIEQILGRHFELDDFQIRSVTEGKEAMGETVVRLRSDGKLYSGRGISTDIIGSSIHAYINAVNKIVFEEEEK